MKLYILAEVKYSLFFFKKSIVYIFNVIFIVNIYISMNIESKIRANFLL